MSQKRKSGDSDAAREAAREAEAAAPAPVVETAPPQAEGVLVEQPEPEAPARVQRAQEREEASPEQRKFTVGRMIVESPRLFGASRHLAAGALADHEPDEELTVAKARAAIDFYTNGDGGE